MGSVGQHVLEALVTKDIRPNTRRSYLVALQPFWGLAMDSLTVSDLNEVLYSIENQNTRRKAVIALRACVDHRAVKALRVPDANPRVYNLPDEDTLRLALMTCPHETRALLMAYGGLRLGEACAVTFKSLDGQWLRVDRQVDETTRKLVPVKTTAGRVPIPTWLVPQVQTLTEVGSPKAVRKALAASGKRVGIHVNPAMLRTWYCNRLIGLGQPPQVVQALMRHKNVRVTFTHYAQAAKADLTSAIEGL